jgi:hypothetical protein
MIALLAIAAYVFTPVVVPDASIFNFYGPNDKGQIALGTTIGSGIWENGTFTLLPAPPTGVADVEASGINNAGTVVGFAFTPDGHEEGFILTGATYSLFSRPDGKTQSRASLPRRGWSREITSTAQVNLQASFTVPPQASSRTQLRPVPTPPSCKASTS